jgi:hypothetical protein
MNLTDFARVGIVIISVISLFVSKCSFPLFLRFLIASMDRCPSVGSGFSTGEYYHLHQKVTETNFLAFFRYQNCAWAPFLLVFVVATGVSGKDFVDPPTAPATVVQVFNFGATIAGYMIPWSALSSDYTAYFHPRVSRFVNSRGGLHQYLISKESAGEFSRTRIWASLFLL